MQNFDKQITKSKSTYWIKSPSPSYKIGTLYNHLCNRDKHNAGSTAKNYTSPCNLQHILATGYSKN